MYLAKFFHRPPGNDDCELLLIPGSQMLIGITMRDLASGADNEFLRQEYATMAEAIAAMRDHTAQLCAGGYVETTHTRYTLRTLLPNPQPKPSWQQGIDELMLAALGEPLEAQAKWIAALAGTSATREPLYLWLAAHHAHAAFPNESRAVRMAEAARDALASRRAGKVPHYAWSIGETDLEGRILDLLYSAQLRADDVAGALETIDLACDLRGNLDRLGRRAWLLCNYFPHRQDEAFDEAYRNAQYAEFADVITHPDYADYVRRRERATKIDKGWRWGARQKPESEDDLRTAERALGAALPPDYRRFLADPGHTNLLVHLPWDSADLRFYRATELKQQRDSLFNFIVRTQVDAEVAVNYFRENYGVSLRDLVPVAEPTNASRCLVVHLGPGDRHGWCYQWDHDGAWELEYAKPNFDEALTTLTNGIERRDANLLRFLGIAPT